MTPTKEDAPVARREAWLVSVPAEALAKSDVLTQAHWELHFCDREIVVT